MATSRKEDSNKPKAAKLQKSKADYRRQLYEKRLAKMQERRQASMTRPKEKSESFYAKNRTLVFVAIILIIGIVVLFLGTRQALFLGPGVPTGEAVFCEQPPGAPCCYVGQAPFQCGDGICATAVGETPQNCPDDCGPPPTDCGDGVCEIDRGENTDNCAQDCPAAVCGDGACQPGETASACPEDCERGTCQGSYDCVIGSGDPDFCSSIGCTPGGRGGQECRGGTKLCTTLASSRSRCEQVSSLGCNWVAADDKTPPTIVSTTPAVGATNVPTSLNIVVQFSEAMNQATVLVPGSISLMPALKSSGAPTFSVDRKTLTLPNVVLDPGVQYTLTIAGGKEFNKDLAGNVLAKDFVVRFTSAGAPAVCSVALDIPATAQAGQAITASATVTGTGCGNVALCARNRNVVKVPNAQGIATETFTPPADFPSAAGEYNFTAALVDRGVNCASPQGPLADTKTLVVGPTDRTPPRVIDNVFETTTTSVTATIRWQTDEPANYTIGYTTDEQKRSFEGSVRRTTFATSHTARITGLQSNTEYFYNVTLCDQSANCVTIDPSFVTKPPPPAEVCGNSIREGAEQCDGADSTACPGRCTATCTCAATVCSGAVNLTLTPSTVQNGSSFVPSVLGLSNCNGFRVNFTLDSCTGQTFGNCTVSGSGCSGANATTSLPGTFVIAACVDINRDTDTSDSGEFDLKVLTVTAPPTPPPAPPPGPPRARCGNNIKEAGEVCDGTDLGGQTCVTQGFDRGSLACATNCQSYITLGCEKVEAPPPAAPPPTPPPPPPPAPRCGNGILEAGEDCDGFSDASCPGFCNQAVCSCPFIVGDGICSEAAGENADISADCERRGFGLGATLLLIIVLLLGLVIFYLYRSGRLDEIMERISGAPPKEIAAEKPFTVAGEEMPARAVSPELKPLQDYVQRTRAQGYNTEQIRKKLQEVGWPDDAIKQVLG